MCREALLTVPWPRSFLTVRLMTFSAWRPPVSPWCGCPLSLLLPRKCTEPRGEAHLSGAASLQVAPKAPVLGDRCQGSLPLMALGSRVLSVLPLPWPTLGAHSQEGRGPSPETHTLSGCGQLAWVVYGFSQRPPCRGVTVSEAEARARDNGQQRLGLQPPREAAQLAEDSIPSSAAGLA